MPEVPFDPEYITGELNFDQNSTENPESRTENLHMAIEIESPKAKPNEDASYISQDGRVVIVADGISRYGGYDNPNHSPSAIVAREVADIAGEYLAEYRRNNPGQEVPRDVFKEAFTSANEAAGSVNALEPNGDSTLAESTDFAFNDLAGTVVAAVVKTESGFDYGMIGDCRIIKLDRDGNVTWNSLEANEDKVDTAGDAFASERNGKRVAEMDEATKLAYLQTIHTKYRNNPLAEEGEDGHATYGVLNGQEEAIDDLYLFTGSVEVAEGETVIACSDGMEPYLAQPEFRQLLIQGDQAAANDYITQHPEIDTAKDDKTLIRLNM